MDPTHFLCATFIGDNTHGVETKKIEVVLSIAQDSSPNRLIDVLLEPDGLLSELDLIELLS